MLSSQSVAGQLLDPQLQHPLFAFCMAFITWQRVLGGDFPSDVALAVMDIFDGERTSATRGIGCAEGK
jgi:hypothetical protein